MEKGELKKGRGRPRKVVKGVAPIVPKKRGRPRKNKEKVDSEESETKLTASLATTHETNSSEGRTWSTHEEFNVNQYKYKDNIPPRALQLISTITDVDGDGNCGFRAAVVSMGKESKTWSDIRKKMKDKVTANSLYSDQKFLVNVFGESAGNMLEGLDWSESGMAPDDLWASPKLDPFWIHYVKEEAKPWGDSI
ncbi:hypothetical protein PSTG_01808 [Puccinia striiformis f. sp. tritici PST-78]|uniref:OTU domain-containing protein n=1 Tax=Puccinia striiformis f. sp. tritici PST-78 TaxID=1165861 RepID=A0A0L0W1P0_9BASI|nr:hypothetical protein PSTG_01808 [Puccinia striiformis f. sp. tritici PST-78]